MKKKVKRKAGRKPRFNLKNFQDLKQTYGSPRHKRATKALWDWLKS